MAIYQTGGYQVKPSAVNKVKQAIKDFVQYVQGSETGTQMYLAWQEKNDPTRFLHLFIFEDAAAQTRHGQSEAVRRFESVYSPELKGGDVVFTDYEMVAGKRDRFGGSEVTNDGQREGASAKSGGEILRQFYAAVVRRDLASARTFLADDLEFVGLFETYRSPDEYLKALAGLLQITVRLDVKRIVAENNNVAVFFELETKAPAAATTFVAEWHHIKNGKIFRVQSAFDGRPFEAMFAGNKRK
jgi:quinol monooxygenase YgiN